MVHYTTSIEQQIITLITDSQDFPNMEAEQMRLQVIKEAIKEAQAIITLYSVKS